MYNTTTPYAGTAGLRPANLFNPDLAWETNKKLETGLELGFLKDKIMIKASYYRNRSSNQLILMKISSVTGYTSIPANFPATAQNSGIELELNTTNISVKNFSWRTGFNLSINRNKLISFPSIESSGYSNLIIGMPMSIQRFYHMIGVNDTTGLYQFADAKGNATYSPNFNSDRTTIINNIPKFYGGLENSFTYRGFSLDFLFQFVKQTGFNAFGTNPRISGVMQNVPESYLDVWHKSGDIARYQKLSQDNGGQVATQLNYAQQSDFGFGDASFIRLKNVSLSWTVPETWRYKMHLQNCPHFYSSAESADHHKL